MSVRLIAFDLDGTLLDEKKRISEANSAALLAAAMKGIWLVPCTARLYEMMPDEVKNLDCVRYVISVNGAEVYDCETAQAICRAEISPETAEKLFDYMDGLSVVYDCYQDGMPWIDRSFYERAEELVGDPETVEMIRRRNPVDGFREEMRRRGRPIQKTQMFFKDLNRRAAEMEQLKERFPMCTIVSSLYNNIEVNGAGANKGAALARLCKHLGITLSECITFGDGNNDISMLKIAGIGIAMENAPDEVKSAADVVTDSNENDGVAKAIHRYALQP